MHHPEGFQELGEVNTAVLVEVDAPSEVVNGLGVDVDAQVGAEEAPGVTELLDGDQTWTQIIKHHLVCTQRRPPVDQSPTAPDSPEWSLSMMLNMISMSVLYRNNVSAKFGVT